MTAALDCMENHQAKERPVSATSALAKTMLFIIGAPRSGTTWLQTMVGDHPMVCTSVELTLFDGYVAPWLKRWQEEAELIKQKRVHSQGLPMAWKEHEFYDFIRGFLERVYSRVLAAKPEATHVLDKRPRYAMHVEEINAFLPDARFIHLLRDGRDVAASTLAAKKSMDFSTANAAQAADGWKHYVIAARKASRFPERFLEVRYEQLLAKPVETLAQVFAFCGLPASAELVDTIVEAGRFDKMKEKQRSPIKEVKHPAAHFRKGQAGSWQTELSVIDRYRFNQFAGDLLVELGYAEKDWWASSKAQKWLVEWGFRVGRLRRFIPGLGRKRKY
jgi:hypothetical protein